MRHLLRAFFIGLPLLGCFLSAASAKHLVGGSLTYEFLGTTAGGDHRYRIQMRTFRDAQPPTTPFDGFVEIGVYEDDVDLNQDKRLTIPYDSNEQKVAIPSGDENCEFSVGLDFRQAIYEDTVTLPPSSNGYHIAHPRCCRNAPTNLQPDMGQWYYAFIPPTKRKNTSPDFNSVPAPYICVGDTVQVSYQSFEPDGDSLAYKLVDPFSGAAPPPGRPKPGAPFTLPLPLNTVSYSAGYSSAQPFGNNGLAKIDPTSGVATFRSSSKGRYAIAVEIQEYRNGKQISTTRRDVQIIVTDCPANNPPSSNIPPKDSSKRFFDVIEGDTARFSADFFDEDPMGLEVSGGVFDEVKKPRASYGSSLDGDTLKADFSWQTKCYHGRKPPYVFNFRVVDSGCPPKTTISTFKVNVIEYPGATISGPDTVCLNKKTGYQALIGKTGSDSVNWQVSGGRIQKGQYTDSITVGWQNTGFQTIKAISSNVNGCNPDTAVLKVNVIKPPYGAAGPDTTFCGGDTIRLGPKAADAVNRYDWPSSPGFLGKQDTANPAYTQVNSSGNLQKLTLLPEISRLACKVTDTVNVSIKPKPGISAIRGDSMPCFEARETYTIQSQGGTQFTWYGDGGKINAGSDVARITWQDSDTGWVGATTTNAFGCKSDTFKKGINVINPVLDTIFGTEVVCPNSSRIRYWVDSSPGNIYQWKVKGGTIASGQGTGQLRVNWGDSGKGYVQAYEKTPQNCLSDTFRLPIQIAFRLETSPIFGDTNVCEKSTHAYNVRYTNGSDYNWWIDSGKKTQKGAENEVQVEWGSEGMGQIAVLETSYDSVNDKECRGDTIRQSVRLNPLPKPGAIQGPNVVCQDDTGLYHVNGFNESRFVWTYDTGKARRLSQDGDSLRLLFDKPGDLNMTVREVTKDSCLSAEKQLGINVKVRPKSKTIVGPDTVCRTSGLENRYQYPGDSTSEFQWQANQGFLTDTTGSGSVGIKWTDSGVQTIKVRELANNGCIGPTVTKAVRVDNLKLITERVTTPKNNPEDLRVEWKAEHKQYWDEVQVISRKPRNGDLWRTINGRLPANQFQYLDQTANPDRTALGYKVTTRNLCNDPVESRLHQAIWLKAEKANERSLKLEWTGYQGWKNGVADYEVLRRTTDTGQQPQYTVVKRLKGDVKDFTVQSPSAGATQCYRIRGFQKGKASVKGISWSNEICKNFPAYVFIPNAFSPWDANNVNDEFRITTANLLSFKLFIYNRWGEKVFETTNPDEGWDGTYNGQAAPTGVYVVKVVFRGNKGIRTREQALRLLR